MSPAPKRFVIWAAALAMVLALTPASGAQEPDPFEPGPEADLSIQLEQPDVPLLVGASAEFGLAVHNDGPEGATGVYVYGYLSDSLEVTESDPACSSDGYGGFSCELGTLAPGTGSRLSVTVERVRAREAWTSFSVSSSNYDTHYENNYVEMYLDPDSSRPADIGVAIEAPSNPAVGADFDYAIKVTNHGPQDAGDVSLTDSLPPGVDYIAWNSSDQSDSCELRTNDYYYEGDKPETVPSYIYRELVCSLGALASGESTTVGIKVRRNDPYELWNSAWVTTSNYDGNYANDYASTSTEADASVTSDLSTEVSLPSTPPLVDESFEVTFTVGNEGPAPTRDASLSGYLGDGVFFESARSDSESVACSANGPYGGAEGGSGGGSASPEPIDGGSAGGGGSSPTEPRDDPAQTPAFYGGSGFNCGLGSLGPGDSVDVIVSLTRLKAREMWVSAGAWSSNSDPNYDNNHGEGLIAADTSNPSDVGVTIHGPSDAEVGDEVVFTIEATNHGPMEARSVILRDSLPYGLEFVSASSSDRDDACSLGGGGPYAETKGGAPYFWGYQEIRCDLGSMGSGESTTVTVVTTRTSEYEVWSTTYLETAGYDSNTENDHASVTLEGEGWDCRARPAGTAESDDIAVYDCPVAGGAGSDSIVVQTDSESRDVDVSAGAGRDVVTVNVPTGSSETRRVEVRTGRGADHVTIVVAPGVTNATVLVSTGDGNDRVTIDAPRLASGLRVIVRGGSGGDAIAPYDSTESLELSWPSGVTLRGGAGADVLTGGYADDRLFGDRGPDSLQGAAGDDDLQGGRGVDTCGGGPGTDTLSSC